MYTIKVLITKEQKYKAKIRADELYKEWEENERKEKNTFQGTVRVESRWENFYEGALGEIIINDYFKGSLLVSAKNYHCDVIYRGITLEIKTQFKDLEEYDGERHKYFPFTKTNTSYQNFNLIGFVRVNKGKEDFALICGFLTKEDFYNFSKPYSVGQIDVREVYGKKIAFEIKKQDKHLLEWNFPTSIEDAIAKLYEQTLIENKDNLLISK